MRRFDYLTESLGHGAMIAFVVFYLILQITAFHGVAITFDWGYLLAFFITIFVAAIIPFSEFVIIGFGIYGLIDLVGKL
tara:strand:+ start:147 stop:383 length:237 start_codon:yes stop_codon:yes gene_type:complete